jgi:hypothetical protein
MSKEFKIQSLGIMVGDIYKIAYEKTMEHIIENIDDLNVTDEKETLDYVFEKITYSIITIEEEVKIGLEQLEKNPELFEEIKNSFYETYDTEESQHLEEEIINEEVPKKSNLQ